MNSKFNNFTTVNQDASLNKTKVTAYIADTVLNSNDTQDQKGKLVIVDNTDNRHPISELLSEYGFYIDDVFIAGGYGFKSYEDANRILTMVTGFDDVYHDIVSNLNKLNNKVFTVSSGEVTIDNSNEFNVDSIYLDAKYNKYGYITSFKYLYVDTVETTSTPNIESPNDEDTIKNIIDYKIYIKEQSNIKQISNIVIEPINDYIEIDDINSATFGKFGIHYEITIANTNSTIEIPYNDNLKIYIKNGSETQIQEINIDDQVEVVSGDISFDKPENNFNDDLEVYIVNVNGEIVYSEKFKELLQWKDKYSFGTNTELNNYNFRNNNNLNNVQEIKDFITISFDATVSITINTVDYNKETFVEFTSNEPSYDYIIFRNSYDVEFYFNGIKSINWKEQTIEINNKNYYIWQSPQQYIGSHTWKIIVNS